MCANHFCDEDCTCEQDELELNTEAYEYGRY